MKKDNKGMSLVELLIAITMLAVVMTPMFRSFLVSMKNNSKARDMFRATTVANNLMESLHAFNLEEICMQFNTEGNFKIYPQAAAVAENGTPATMQYKELGEEVAGTIVKSGVISNNAEGNPQYNFKGTPSKKYYFVMKNIMEDGVLFDARITLDSSKYREGDSEITQEELQYNDQYTFDVDAINTLTDAVFVCKAAEEKKAFKEIMEQYNDSHESNVSIQDIVKNVRREIVISFQEYNGVDNVYENGAYVNLDIKYIYEGKEYINLLNKVHAVTDVRNVYVMYYPNYYSVDGNITDEIIVKSDREIPFKLYLIKQNLEETEANYLEEYYGSGITLEELDSNYWVSLSIMDLAHSAEKIGQNDFVSMVNLRTNLCSKITATNLEKVYKHLNIRYFDKDNVQMWPYIAVGTFNENVGRILQFVDDYPQSLAGEIKNENLMYETTIEIFPEGTYDSGLDNMNEDNRMLIINRK